MQKKGTGISMADYKRRRLGSSIFKGMMAAGLAFDLNNMMGWIAGQCSDVPAASGSNKQGADIAFGNSRDGFSRGHSSSYWKEMAAEEYAENGKSASYNYYMKCLKEALEDKASSS